MEAKLGFSYTHIASNKNYRVLDIVTHTETLEKLVVYCESPSGFPMRKWARPKKMFEDGRFKETTYE